MLSCGLLFYILDRSNFIFRDSLLQIYTIIIVHLAYEMTAGIKLSQYYICLKIFEFSKSSR